MRNLRELEQQRTELLAGSTRTVPVLVTFEREKKRYLSVVTVGNYRSQNIGVETRKAWLPMETQVLTRDLARMLGLGEQKGMRITYVYPGSTAEPAGLKVGEILTRLDGQEIHHQAYGASGGG